ncbi:ras-related protein Rab-24 isoform X1 [Hydra vulgaris]|uniref:ras-related protein Rab-24 isoform X1 n=1 Tax=Hydra vulgaris TaxID=6087 RepID=UPI001F5EC1C5|nr:ras-related protein Rab-24 isoform X1 [Hydra vulgaris]
MASQKVDLKVVLLGKEYGGKTSLVERFLYSRFNSTIPYQNTIGAAFGAKSMTVQGKSVTLGLWDTAGSERYEAMSRIYYRGAKAAVVCFDLTDRSSWERAKFWVDEVRLHEPTCKVYLCGTKLDLVDEKNRPIDYYDTKDFAELANLKSFETSSKTGENIDELFNQIVSDYLDLQPATLNMKHENRGHHINKLTQNNLQVLVDQDIVKIEQKTQDDKSCF